MTQRGNRREQVFFEDGDYELYLDLLSDAAADVTGQVYNVAGPKIALEEVDRLAGDLDRYHLLHAARADLLRRLGSSEEAAKSYARALALVTNDAERRFLARRLREVQQRDRP